MDINKKSRAELKGYFVKNAIPTEGNFADLIDAAINQKDDGLTKAAGEALGIESAGASKTALRLYGSFSDVNPAWTLSLVDSTAPADGGANRGLTVSDGAGTTRLFISGTTGLVSASSLAIAGSATVGSLTVNGALNLSGGLNVPAGQNLVLGSVTTTGRLLANAGITVATEQTLIAGGAVSAAGLLTANGGLTVNGALTANGTLSVPAGRSLAVSGTLSVPPTGIVRMGQPMRTGVRLDPSASQFVSIPAITSANLLGVFSSGFTLQTWIYCYAMPNSMRLIDFGNGWPLDNILLSLSSDGALHFGVVKNGVNTYVDSPAGVLCCNTWTHVAVTLDASGGAKLYRNGLLVATGSLPLPAAVARNNNYIGRSNAAGDPYWNGLFSEYSLWTGVQPVSMNPLTGNETGLIAYWKMNETTGVTAANACTNALRLDNGTLSPATGTVPQFASASDRPQQITIDQEDWITAALQDGWMAFSQGYSTAGFCKDSFGIVHLRGMIKKGASSTAAIHYNTGSSLLFMLPPGYRPQAAETFMTVSYEALARIEIHPSGQVVLMIGNAAWLTLAGITFRAFA